MIKTQLSSHHGANFRLDNAPLSIRNGVLRADDYDDIYFSDDNGLAESYHVFIEGSKLAKRFCFRSQITIAETGFGTGLNFLSVLQLLNQFPDCQVDFVSFESRPLEALLMQKVHSIFPSISAVSAELLDVLPPRWPGLHLCQLRGGRVRLHLLYGSAEEHLVDANFLADAWFLGGFSPAKNPQFWNANVLAQIGRLTRPGGSVASFTSASKIRKGLSKAGFKITECPGFAQKRNMIIGIKSGGAPTLTTPNTVGVIGGGIAGASVAAGLRDRGITATILDAGGSLATGASGNKLALQSPRLSVDHNCASQLSVSCLSYAARCSDKSGATVGQSVLSLNWPEREAIRHAKFGKQFWPDDLLRLVDANMASKFSGVVMEHGGIVHDYGRVIEPVALCKYLADYTEKIFNFEVSRVISQDKDITVMAKDGRQFDFDAIVVTSGANLPDLLQILDIVGVRLDITAGQVSHVPIQSSFVDLKVGLSFGGYFTPSHNGFHQLGATFDRSGYAGFDHNAFVHNRMLLPPDLRNMLASHDSCGGRVSRRVSPPDRNPMMGRLADRVFVLGALGARGLTLGPLLGTLLAAQVANMPVTIGRPIQAGVDPFRFRRMLGL